MIKFKKLTLAIILLVFGWYLLLAAMHNWWPWNVGVKQENSTQTFSSRGECEMATGKICTPTLCALYIGNNCKSHWIPTEEDKAHDSLKNWQAYRNEELGFEFKYPSTWQQRPKPPDGYAAEFWMPDYHEKDAAYWIKVEHYSGLFAIKLPACELPDCVQRTVRSFYVEERGLVADARITIPIPFPDSGTIIISMTPVNADYQGKNVFNEILSSFEFLDKINQANSQRYYQASLAADQKSISLSLNGRTFDGIYLSDITSFDGGIPEKNYSFRSLYYDSKSDKIYFTVVNDAKPEYSSSRQALFSFDINSAKFKFERLVE